MDGWMDGWVGGWMDEWDEMAEKAEDENDNASIFTNLTIKNHLSPRFLHHHDSKLLPPPPPPLLLSLYPSLLLISLSTSALTSLLVPCVSG